MARRELRPLAEREEVGHPSRMQSAPQGEDVIPSARVADLEPDRPEDDEEEERRFMALAATRIAAERVRLERLGIIDDKCDLVSRELPPDMRPESETTVETG